MRPRPPHMCLSVRFGPQPFNGSRAEFGFMPLRDLILYAYGVKPTQLKGPEWLADDGRPYDIEATMPASASPAEVGIVTASKWRMLGGVCPSPCAKVVPAERTGKTEFY